MCTYHYLMFHDAHFIMAIFFVNIDTGKLRLKLNNQFVNTVNEYH